MGRRALLLVAWLGVATIAVAAPSTPEQWQNAANQDLQAIHDLLRDNSPAMVVDRDSAHFRSWLEQGLRESQMELAKVRDGRGYSSLVTGYVAGFRDPHIAWWPRPESGIDSLRKTHSTLSDGASARKLALAPWGEKAWWITLPGMSADQDWNSFFVAINDHLPSLRAAKWVVIDLRGNSGGDSSFGDRLARLLWGNDMVEALKPALGATVWRASRLNRDYWAKLLEERLANPQTSSDVEGIQALRDILSEHDRALAHGAATFELDDAPPARKNAAGTNFVQGRVILLTDEACVSACLDLMDEFTAMPGVVQAGRATSADTIFMEFTPVPVLPSGLSSFGFGQKAWIERPRGSNQPYTPSPELLWSGPAWDDEGVKRWLKDAIQRR